ncbi:MAG: TetR/AcrR family transcriptional regulator [Phenylobacterium sp.]
MGRAAGQIDIAKSEAILEAAAEVMAERGVQAPVDEIARRAGVSKQTIYNHYGSKAEMVRVLATRRVQEITAALDAPEAMEDPQSALAGYARVLLQVLLQPKGLSLFRMCMLGAEAMPEISRAMYEAGPRSSRRRLARFLEAETRAGRLACPDPMEAAEFFGGMVVSTRQTALMLGVPQTLTQAEADRIASEAAARFLKAYAP